MMGYGRTSYRGRSTRPVTAGRVARVNARPGDCRDCGETIPAGAGQLDREHGGAWSVIHVEATQGGWLMHPQPVRGGCPEATDKRNAELHASGFLANGSDGPVPAPASERENIADTAASYAATHEIRPERVHYGYNSRGRGRCEDAPCCGCCD